MREWFINQPVMFKEQSSQLISSDAVSALLGDARARFNVSALAECSSTNTLLCEMAQQGAGSGAVVVTDFQRAGRGSRSRTWQSSPEESLTFSVLWQFSQGLECMAGLSLAVGLAVANALKDCGASGVGLKWPNDILYQDRKLGGILVELQARTTEAGEANALAICGIGLNLKKPVTEEAFLLPVASLDEMLHPLPERNLLFSKLLIALAEVFDCFDQQGFAGIRDPWQAYHAWQDRPVTLSREGVVIDEGVCRGADVDGALLVESSQGIQRCLSGDLSLKVRLS